MGHNIKNITNISELEHKQIVNIISNIWRLGRKSFKEENGKELAHLYLMECCEKSTDLYLALNNDNNIVGFMFFKDIDKTNNISINVDWKIPNTIKAKYNVYNKDFSFINKYLDEFDDSELVLLAVDPSMQKQGVGKLLTNSLPAKTYKLWTVQETCDASYYVNNGYILESNIVFKRNVPVKKYYTAQIFRKIQ